MFLLGKSIPEHIRNLPQTFLNTPFGQMMKPQIEAALRGVTQAPDAGATTTTTTPSQSQHGTVRNVTTLAHLDRELAAAAHSCAVIFFTSATCPPCKLVYPVYDELAEEAGDKGVLIKVDISSAYDIASRYAIRATPTFTSFLRGKQDHTWTGANANELRGNVRLLLATAHPTHPHRTLSLPSLQRTLPQTSYIQYKTIPNLDKLTAKLHPLDKDPILPDLTSHLTSPSTSPNNPLPTTLKDLPNYITKALTTLPTTSHFALTDLIRLLTLDPRISSYLATEPDQPTLHALLPSPSTEIPYNQKLTTIHLTTNLFTSHLAAQTLLSTPSLLTRALSLLTTSLLDTKPALKVSAVSLAHNIAVYTHNTRFEGSPDPLSEDDQVQLVASLIETIATEESSPEALEGMISALGLLVYEAPVDGAVLDLCKAMEIADRVKGKLALGLGEKVGKVVMEVGGLLGSL
ncbi:PUL domain-containing protein [Aspergillus avenaceus]|uniref:PUL domain-containing protein n=1 Tax=Aspergillus avenaceus TaxID=36643 RepID=A0A5N6U8L2_ASPAV|nr:PUL domain-containing protein [Aspergillus avenaceus]